MSSSRRYPVDISNDDDSAQLSADGDATAVDPDDSSVTSGDVADLLRGGGKFLLQGPSVKELNHKLRLTRDEMRLLQEENTRLRAREIEISSLSLRLQQQFSATQQQVDGLKASVRLLLLNPISDEEYVRIEGLSEDKRDLLDTIKVGIYQQLGSLRNRAEGAMKRSNELAADVASLTASNKSLTRELADVNVSHEHELGSLRRQMTQLEQRGATVAELTAKVADLESRLQNAHIHQEDFINAKILAAAKTNECARLSVALKEAESDAARHRTLSECCEQKLDILKAEYYDTRLKYNQQVMELESRLRLADEKLKLMGDVELEAEIFISNMAVAIQEGSGSLSLMDGGGSSLQLAGSIPPSRTLQHALIVTKRCISLENSIASMKQQLTHKDAQIARLQQSLEHARSVLQNSNSPYAVVERTMEKLGKDVEDLQKANDLLREENAILSDKVSKSVRDAEVLARHRAELMKMRATLTQLAQENAHGSPQQHHSQRAVTQFVAASPSKDAGSPQRQQQPKQRSQASQQHQGHSEGFASSINVAAPMIEPRTSTISVPQIFRASDGSTSFTPEAIEIS
jgi:hypothetical protein